MHVNIAAFFKEAFFGTKRCTSMNGGDSVDYLTCCGVKKVAFHCTLTSLSEN